MDRKLLEEIKNNISQIDDEDCIVEVKGLSKRYKRSDVDAVSDMNFKCFAGEIVGLLGANGAGKSTTLKCLTGIVPFIDGEISVCGRSVKSEPAAAKMCFGFVSDNHAVFPKMTGLEYIGFMADIYGVSAAERKQRIEEMQKCFCLGNKIENIISSYSHGMKQKICMMGSLIHCPKLWILDEPMVGLDYATTEAVSQFMKDYAAKGNTILFSTHNLDAVSRLCDRAIVVENGGVALNVDMSEKDAHDKLVSFFGNEQKIQYIKNEDIYNEAAGS